MLVLEGVFNYKHTVAHVPTARISGSLRYAMRTSRRVSTQDNFLSK